MTTSLLALACAIAASFAWAAPVPPDERITQAVEDELAYDSAVPFQRIEVTTSDGVVRLTGRVGHILARDRAVRVTESVRGVRAIVNEIDVAPRETRADRAIQVDIEDALLVDKATEDYELSVELEDGEVLLTGTVDSYQEKRLAERIAKGVKGVTAVDNDLLVDYKLERPDIEIQADVEGALEWDVLVDSSLIAVEVEDGVVRMVGSVGSLAEKRRAAARAWVAGVDDVDDSDLDIRPWARDEDQKKSEVVYRTDDEIRQAVEDALLYDPRVDSLEVTTTVERGNVTLRGTVDTLKARRAAEQDARNTVGTKRVLNRLTVRPDPRTDDEIRSQVSRAFLRDPMVERYELGVRVEDGRVTLTGEVGTYFEKAQAEDLASTIAGVTGLKNRIVVDPHETPDVYNPYVDEHFLHSYDWYGLYDERLTFKSDAEILEDVEAQLWWSPFVDVDEVQVTVENGVVTLTGVVDTWAERDAATENAFEGGAVTVDNDLVIRRIRPGPKS